MTYEEAKRTRDRLEAEVKEAKRSLREAGSSTGDFGLTSDLVKGTPGYKQGKALLDRKFQELQKFNEAFVRGFAKEIREERRSRG